MTVVGPTRARRQLGSRLRRLRESARKRLVDIPNDIMSSTKLMKIEQGKQNVKIVDIWALCRLYNVTDGPSIEILETLAKAGSEQGWWEDYRDIVPEHLGLYVGYEEDADGITFYHPEVVYGLFQIPEYARAVIAADDPDASGEEVDRRVGFRMQRQTRVLERPAPPKFKVILGAAALNLEVGSRAIRDEQLRHLIKLGTRRNIDVRVLPWGAGAHAGLRGPFTMLDFDDEDAPVTIFTETHAGARYMETPEDVQLYRRITERLLAKTVPIKEYA